MGCFDMRETAIVQKMQVHSGHMFGIDQLWTQPLSLSAMCLQVRNVYVKKWCPYYIHFKDGFDIVYLILVEYTELAGHKCGGSEIQSYTSLQEAKTACENNINCKCIDDYGCDGNKWFIKTAAAYAASGLCAWNKGKLAL